LEDPQANQYEDDNRELYCVCLSRLTSNRRVVLFDERKQPCMNDAVVITHYPTYVYLVDSLF